MRLRIFTEPHRGARYSTLLRLARATEDLGFDGFFRSDHYLSSGPVREPPGPTDAWITLAGLARETHRVRLGTLVSPTTFRLPGPLAVTVAQVDDMSGGRIEFGLGTGWVEEEHAAYGIPFPSLAERFERLEEQLEIVTGMWATAPGDLYSYAGRHYTVTASPALAKPVQRPRPPILMGGFGVRRTPALAARFADEFNVPFRGVAETGAAFARVRAACDAVGRDPRSLRYSTAQVVCCGRDRAEVARRAAAIGRDPDDLREHGLAGSVSDIAARIDGFAAVGADTLYLQILDLADVDHLEQLAELLPPDPAT